MSIDVDYHIGNRQISDLTQAEAGLLQNMEHEAVPTLVMNQATPMIINHKVANISADKMESQSAPFTEQSQIADDQAGQHAAPSSSYALPEAHIQVSDRRKSAEETTTHTTEPIIRNGAGLRRSRSMSNMPVSDARSPMFGTDLSTWVDSWSTETRGSVEIEESFQGRSPSPDGGSSFGYSSEHHGYQRSAVDEDLADVEAQLHTPPQPHAYTYHDYIYEERETQGFQSMMGENARTSFGLDHDQTQYNPFIPHAKTVKYWETEASSSRPRPTPITSGGDNPIVFPNIVTNDDRLITKLNRVEWQQFTRELRQNTTSRRFVIDVLVGEPDFFGKSEARSRSVTGDLDSDGDATISQYVNRFKAADARMDRERGPKPFYHVRGALPERIRINSRIILQFLKKEIGQGFRALHDRQPFVIVRPFRALIQYQQQIRSHCTTLEQSIQQSGHSSGLKSSTADLAGCEARPHESSSQLAMGEGPDGSASVSPAGCANNAYVTANNLFPGRSRSMRNSFKFRKKSDQSKWTSMQIKLEHLRCLLSFIDGDINARLQYLSGNEPMRITFPDIWYLFEPGSEVILPDNRQAFRVLAVTSTGHKYVSRQDQFRFGQGPGEQASTVLHCIYIDFDGSQMGPVSVKFEIPRFDGERLVTSLQVYPFRFSAQPRIREKLVERGRLFPRYTGIRHMQFNGVTLWDHEEIDGEVVIDAEEAVARRSDWKPLIQSFVGITPGGPGLGQPCLAPCCAADNVLDDGFVEEIRNESYMINLTGRMSKTHETLPSIAIYPRTRSEITDMENPIKDDEYLLMSNRVFGFVLHNRKWGKSQISTCPP